MNSWYAADATAFCTLRSPLFVLHAAFRTRPLSRRFQNSPTHTAFPPTFPRFRLIFHHPLQSAGGWLQSTHLFLFFLASRGIAACYCCKLFMHFEVYLKHEQQHSPRIPCTAFQMLFEIPIPIPISRFCSSASALLLLFVDFMNCFSCFTCSQSGALRPHMVTLIFPEAGAGTGAVSGGRFCCIK